MQNKNKSGFSKILILLILNLFIFSAASSAQEGGNYVNLNGNLEVLHADDFEHPENSKYIFYLNVGGKRYELTSDKQLPVVISGTPANVKGNLADNKIYVQSLTIQPPSSNAAPALSQQEQAVLSDGSKEK